MKLKITETRRFSIDEEVLKEYKDWLDGDIPTEENFKIFFFGTYYLDDFEDDYSDGLVIENFKTWVNQ